MPCLKKNLDTTETANFWADFEQRMNGKVKSFKQKMSLSEQCAVSKVTTSVLSVVFRPVDE